MKEICLVNKGENIKKIGFQLGLNIKNTDINYIGNMPYVTIEDGTDDIIIVRNYHPLQIKTLDSDNQLDIYASGYEIVGNEQIKSGGKAVISKVSAIRYSVAPMEKLEDIAYKFGVSKQSIIEQNSLLTDKLFVGQILLI